MSTVVQILRTQYDEQVRAQPSTRPQLGAIVERIALVAATHYGTHGTVSHAPLPISAQDDIAAVVAKVRRSAEARGEPVEWQIYAHDPAAAQLAHELTAAGFTPGWQRSVLIAEIDDTATPALAGPTWTVEPIRDTGTPCPSAVDRDANRHRSGAAWIVRTVQEILSNPVYTGRMVWNRQRPDRILVDPDNPSLGQREVSRWNKPEDWVISEQPVHPALVSEADFVAVQGLRATRRDARHTYLLTALLRCALCDRAFEGHWVHETAGYRCRHGHTSAKTTDHERPKNTYLPEKAHHRETAPTAPTAHRCRNRPRKTLALLPTPPRPSRRPPHPRR